MSLIMKSAFDHSSRPNSVPPTFHPHNLFPSQILPSHLLGLRNNSFIRDSPPNVCTIFISNTRATCPVHCLHFTILIIICTQIIAYFLYLVPLFSLIYFTLFPPYTFIIALFIPLCFTSIQSNYVNIYERLCESKVSYYFVRICKCNYN